MNRSVIKYSTFLGFILFISLAFESCSGCSQSDRRLKKYNDKTISDELDNDKIKNSNREKHVDDDDSNNPSEKVIIQEETSSSQPILISGNKSVAQMFTELKNGVFMVFALDDDGNGSQGSGFFINSSGIGVTNYHVLEGHDNYFIKTADGNKYRISEILESSKPEENDYVIFKVASEGTYFQRVPIAINRTIIGADVFAIGSPKGLENSLTRGSVSQFRENHRIQIDATIDHGSSGGPLFNMNGEVIGITSEGFEGSALNFAVDIRIVPYQKYIRKIKNQALSFSHTSTTGQIIKHKYFTVSYSENDEQAEWVSYKITDDNINDNVSRTNDYRYDPFVSTKSSNIYDYKGSGYDKGHLAPARTMSHNETSMSESFYMSNISPQDKNFNRGIWKRLEQKVRYWSFYNDSTFVVTGPILTSPIGKIGQNNVTVPRAFYKVLVGFKDNIPAGIAFIMPNEPSNKSLYTYATTIDYIEELTGIDFYYNLNNQIQKEIESNGDIKKWALK